MHRLNMVSHSGTQIEPCFESKYSRDSFQTSVHQEEVSEQVHQDHSNKVRQVKHPIEGVLSAICFFSTIVYGFMFGDAKGDMLL